MISIDESRSYATEANLLTALKRLGFDTCRPIIVRNRDGRWTAVFGLHVSGAGATGDVMRFARHGFMTIN